MYKRRLFHIFLLILIPVFLISGIVVIYQCCCRTLSINIGEISECVYVPSGIADDYKNLLTFGIDEHTIWTYELNETETDLMEQNLNNGIWLEMTNEDIDENMYFFADLLVSYWPENMSDNLYYCLYDFSLKKFVSSSDVVAMLGWHRLLFIYDMENRVYYCVSKSI